MALPNFLCAGALRSGTTYLHNVLVQHPDVCVSRPKEANFFDRAVEHHRGLIFYERRFFNHYRGEPLIGDFTPSVMYYPRAPELLRKHLGPDVKFLFSLRNPVERAYSHYIGGYKDMKENETFSRALELEPERLKQGYWWGWSYGYLDRGFYARQIRRLLEHFPRENMCFVILEQDWGDNTGRTLERIQDFLGLPRAELNPDVTRHPRMLLDVGLLMEDTEVGMGKELVVLPKNTVLILKGKNVVDYIAHPSDEVLAFVAKHNRNRPPLHLAPASRIELTRHHFLDDIRDLEAVTGRDLSCWLEQ